MSLPHLMGAYFHPHWRFDANEPSDVVTDFVVGEGVAMPRQALDDIDLLLGCGYDDAELTRIVIQDLRAYYDPHGSGDTMAEWLRWVRSQLVQQADQQNQ